MFILFSGVSHSWTPATLTGSMETSFSEMTRPKYLICSLQNSYFSGQRKSLFSCKTCNTHQTACVYSSSVLVKIRMLSRCYESPGKERVSCAFEQLISNIKSYNGVKI